MTQTDITAAVSQLEDSANHAISQLNALAEPVSSLQSGLSAMQGSYAINDLLMTQLDDINTVFTTIVDIFSFLDSIKVLDNVFAEASKTISTQQGQVHDIQAGLPDLKSQLDTIASKVSMSEAQWPDSTTISGAVSVLNSWIHAANSLSSTFNLLGEKVEKGDQETQLNTISAAFVKDCGQLSSNISAISSSCSTISNNVNSILSSMADYGKAIEPLAGNSSLIASSSMDHLNSTVKKLKTINAILNPISIVLDVSGCADPASKAAYNSTLNGVKTSLTNQASSIASEVTVAINAFVSTTSSGFIPLAPLYSDLETAQQAFNSDSITSIDGHIEDLTSQVTALTNLLQAAPYTSVVNGKTSPGSFLSAENVTALNVLLKSVSNN